MNQQNDEPAQTNPSSVSEVPGPTSTPSDLAPGDPAVEQPIAGLHPGEIGLDWETKGITPTPTETAVAGHPGEIRIQGILGEGGDPGEIRIQGILEEGGDRTEE